MQHAVLELLRRCGSLRVLVIGDLMLDRYAMGDAKRLSREAPAPVFEAFAVEAACGGAANTARNTASLGARTTLIGLVGDDDAGAHLRELLQADGVCTTEMVRSFRGRTLVKTRYSVDGQMLFRADEGGFEEDPADASALIERIEPAWNDADAIIVSDYGYGCLTEPVLAAITRLQATEPRVLAADSHNFGHLRGLGPTIVKPNFSEVLPLLERDEAMADRITVIARNQQRILAETGAKIAAVTIDRDGALVLEQGEDPLHVPAGNHPRPQAIGAGDTYLSAFTLAYAALEDTRLAAAAATAAAATVVDKPGTATCSAAEMILGIVGSPVVVAEREDFALLMECYRHLRKRVVFTNGCFDILHSGHVQLLEGARALGDALVVAINTDASVARLKGPDRPVNGLDERIAVLAGLDCVDCIVTFDEDRPIELLRLTRPAVYAKGGDYRRDMLEEAPVAEEMGCRIEFLPYVEDRSTTRVIEQIQRRETAGAER